MTRYLKPLDNIQHTTYNQRMIRTQVYIPNELYNQAKLLAKLEGVSISEYMREGLSMKVSLQKNIVKNSKKKKSKKDPMASLVGMFSLGKGIVTNVALNHNDIYDE